MAETFDTTITITGPIFDGSGLKVLQGVVNRGLLDMAILEGANKVADQLYGPPAHLYYQADPSERHGAHTRTLKRAIGVRVDNDNEVIVDAFSNSESGQPLSYASNVEARYHMFRNTSNEINRNKSALQDKYIGDAVVEAFQ